MKKIIIANRTESKAKEFATRLKEKNLKAEILSCSLNSEKITEYLKEFPIVVQSTCLGLQMDDALPFNLEYLKNGMRIFDMIYTDTRFLIEVKKRECIAINGLLMLLYQGIKSFEIWTGKKVPVEVMKKSLEAVK